ncbi:MAG: superoxide dismutase [Planctomycetota bacterium]|jgi:Fe-Mn family superoxide dismutase
MTSHHVPGHDARPTPIDPLDRRQMLAALGLGAAGFAAATGLDAGAAAQATSPDRRTGGGSHAGAGWDATRGEYVLPDLPYHYDALEPHIDAETMHLHHDKHHAGYVRGLNAALAALDEIRGGGRSASEVKHWSRQLAFAGSGHFLHVVFWNCMGPDGGGQPGGALAKAIDGSFGSFKAFADHFRAAAGSVEGSGWGLLVVEPVSRRLLVMQAEKHQNLTAWGVVPLVVVDVWEHAYYLKYQNRRKDYVAAFMDVINWDFASRKYEGIMGAIGM